MRYPGKHESRNKIPRGRWRACDDERRAVAALARLIAKERDHAERAPLEVLLERAIVATGYDLATLSRPGGDRRLANLRKLMRLAGEYERRARAATCGASSPTPRPGPGGGARARRRWSPRAWTRSAR